MSIPYEKLCRIFENIWAFPMKNIIHMYQMKLAEIRAFENL